MFAASKLAPSTAKQFVAFFESLRKTDDVPERLVLLGLATRGVDGTIALREAKSRRMREDIDAGPNQSL